MQVARWQLSAEVISQLNLDVSLCEDFLPMDTKRGRAPVSYLF